MSGWNPVADLQSVSSACFSEWHGGRKERRVILIAVIPMWHITHRRRTRAQSQMATSIRQYGHKLGQGLMRLWGGIRSLGGLFVFVMNKRRNTHSVDS